MNTDALREDKNFSDFVIERVEQSADDPTRFTIMFDGSCGFGMANEQDVHEPPKVGETLRLYGNSNRLSLGSTIRGASVGGRVYFYRTQDEQRAKEETEQKARVDERIADFEKNRSKFDADVAALPEVFRERMRLFREKAGWEQHYGPYELACCKTAVQLAERFKTPSAIEAFLKLDYPKQREIAPEIDKDLTGNMMGVAFRLSIAFVGGQADQVPKIHGAMCPLAGCEEYGCYAARGKTAG